MLKNYKKRKEIEEKVLKIYRKISPSHRNLINDKTKKQFFNHFMKHEHTSKFYVRRKKHIIHLISLILLVFRLFSQIKVTGEHTTSDCVSIPFLYIFSHISLST